MARFFFIFNTLSFELNFVFDLEFPFKNCFHLVSITIRRTWSAEGLEIKARMS